LPEEKVIAAAKAALAHDFILEMPGGNIKTLIATAAKDFRRPTPSGLQSHARC